MTELLTTLEDAMVLSFYTDDDGDYHVTQFEPAEEFDALLETADEFEYAEYDTCYRFGSVWMVVTEDLGEDE